MLKKLKKIFYKNESSEKKGVILIVEDSKIDQKILSQIVEKNGYQAVIACNGVEGLALAETTNPCLVLLDCEMPIMGGPEMCRHLKSEPTLKHIPVLFITAYDTPKNILECFELDSENMLIKPVNAKLLMDHIDYVLYSDPKGE